MIRHYYTLHHIVNELQSLVGCRLEECFSQEQNALVFTFSDGRDYSYIQYYGQPGTASLFARKNYSRASKNTVDLFHKLIGDVLQNIVLLDNDRIIRLDFIKMKLYFFLFGGSNSNVIAVNYNNIIIESLKSKKMQPGTIFIQPQTTLLPFDILIEQHDVLASLTKSDFNLGKYYAEEVLIRSNIPIKKDVETGLKPVSRLDMNSIKHYAEIVRSECLLSKKYYILETEDGIIFSLIPLTKYPKIIDTFDNVSDGIFKRLISEIKSGNFDSLYKDLFNRLSKQKQKLEKNIDRIKDENVIFERADKYKLFGELLMSHPQMKMKSGKTISLPDYSGNEIIIPLDEKMTLSDNANKYFDKYKNTKEELRIRKKRLPDLELRLLKIENALKRLDEQNNFRELDKFKKNLKELTGIRFEEQSDDVSSKFREFDLGEGYMLYVGKNAANNDELTMKFAKPNDIWLHARGSGGSHCVLRMPGTQKPPKLIMQKAASISAYYSQARNAKYVPVAYTLKKYVRKPKGANPGSVIISKEEVIMVSPQLPQ